MRYLVVADWNGDNIVTHEASADDEARAIELLDIMISEGHPDAFFVLDPGGRHGYKVVDPVAKTVTFDQEGSDQRNAMVLWASFRTERNTKLVDSDWTQYNDSPLTDEVKAEWTVHRQALRDLPANTDDPADPTWPTPPE